MKHTEITALNTLFHTDWHPERGDFIMENSIKEGKIMGNRLLRHRITVWILSTLVVVSFVTSIVLLSI